MESQNDSSAYNQAMLRRAIQRRAKMVTSIAVVAAVAIIIWKKGSQESNLLGETKECIETI